MKILQTGLFMAVKLIDISDYSPKSSDIFFFDNNIWMFLFCPLANFGKNKQKVYSSFLKEIKIADSTIFISSLILSEFANRYFRMDYELWKSETTPVNPSFKKEYIGSMRYSGTVIEVKKQIKRILKICERTPDNFNAINMEMILRHLEYIDFNDSYFIEMINLNDFSKWKLVTDDQDFIKYQDHDSEIITILK